ncbi:MAG: cupin domain-containing protein [Pseudanabaenaceae cyanobacterium bins.68]|nr:cupin domain-containing protein [Pseudanabaenaceae cyanobacterium bins.68]
MAVLTIPSEQRQILEPEEIQAYLRKINIGFEQWQANQPLTAEATAEQVLAAYEPEIAQLNARGGYVTADVIDIHADTPNLEVMLAKFNREHYHNEDEVRFTIAGRGLFHINPQTSAVVSVTVEAGDLLVVPKGTWHWFNLCSERRIRAIRLFQDMSGWLPHYSDSKIEENFQPLCFA